MSIVLRARSSASGGSDFQQEGWSSSGPQFRIQRPSGLRLCALLGIECGSWVSLSPHALPEKPGQCSGRALGRTSSVPSTFCLATYCKGSRDPTTVPPATREHPLSVSPGHRAGHSSGEQEGVPPQVPQAPADLYRHPTSPSPRQGPNQVFRHFLETSPGCKLSHFCQGAHGSLPPIPGCKAWESPSSSGVLCSLWPGRSEPQMNLPSNCSLHSHFAFSSPTSLCLPSQQGFCPLIHSVH